MATSRQSTMQDRLPFGALFASPYCAAPPLCGGVFVSNNRGEVTTVVDPNDPNTVMPDGAPADPLLNNQGKVVFTHGGLTAYAVASKEVRNIGSLGHGYLGYGSSGSHLWVLAGEPSTPPTQPNPAN